MGISNAIVIGGGIGGLAAAAALSRRGMAVTLLEQAPAITEVGAGLQISPNGIAVLRAMGLDAKLTERAAVRGQAVVLQDYKAGARVARLDLMRGQGAYPYMFVHRADLVDILLGAAKRGNVTIELGAEVAEVTPGATPQLRLKVGSRRRAELIVDASGIHSRARAGRSRGARLCAMTSTTPTRPMSPWGRAAIWSATLCAAGGWSIWSR